MLPGASSGAAAELLEVWSWSARVLQSRLVRWWTGDATLPLVCNACPYLFRPSRLPTPFAAAERYLPALCNCTGPVGCRFPRSGPGNRSRLEFCRIPASLK